MTVQTDQIPFQINKGDKFGCLSIYRASVDLKSGLYLGDNLWILPESPFSIFNHWKEWLGTLRHEEIEKADLTIVSKLKSKNLNFIDEENDSLFNKVASCYQYSTFLGITNDTSGHIITGNFSGDNPEIQTLGTPTDYFSSGERTAFTSDHFLKVNEMQNKFSEILKTNEYARLKRGAGAFFEAMSQQDLGNRIHQIVRSIEAIIFPPIGKTREVFSKRSELLSTKGSNSRLIFEEIYDLRSCIEHMHEIVNYEKFSPEILKLSLLEQQKRFQIKLQQAEEFSRFLYTKIILSKELLPFFKTNESILELWRRFESGDLSFFGEVFNFSNIH